MAERGDLAYLMALLPWYERCGRKLPWRGTRDPYRIWVSEIMLQQTRVETVLAYYEPFLEAFPNVRALADAQEDELMRRWQGLGYYRRMRNLQKGAQHIAATGRMPDSYEGWLQIPGVGRYTAAAIASFAFDEPRAVVDGNVLRVLCRFRADDSDIRREAFRRRLEEELSARLSRGTAAAFNQAIMDLGATVCTPAGQPACSACPLADGCAAYEDRTQSHYPVKAAAQQRPKERFLLPLAVCEGQAALVRRPDSGLLAGLYGFPMVKPLEGGSEEESMLRFLSLHKLRPNGPGFLRRLEAYRHIFTHREWELVPYLLSVERDEAAARLDMVSDTLPAANVTEEAEVLLWFSLEELGRQVPLPSAFMPAVRQLSQHKPAILK